MNIPNTMKMNATTPLQREMLRCATRRRRRRSGRPARRRRPPGRIAARPRSLTASAIGLARRLRGRARRAASASAASGSRVWTVATTERPGRSGDLLQHLLGEGDAHRDALHDLGEVAGRVVRRQERELRARGRARSTTRRPRSPCRRARRWLTSTFCPGLTLVELGLLEIGVDVGRVERHERHQSRARLHEIADLGRLVADHAVERRDDPGERRGRARALASAVTSSSRVRAASSRCALSTSSLAFAPSSAAAAARALALAAAIAAIVRSRSAVACSRRCCEPKLVWASLKERSYSSAARSASAWADFSCACDGVDLRLRLGDDRALRLDLAAEAGDRRVLGVDLALRRRRPRAGSRRRRSARADRPCWTVWLSTTGTCSRWPERLGGDDRGVGADIGVVGRDEEAPLDEIVVSPLARVADARPAARPAGRDAARLPERLGAAAATGAPPPGLGAAGRPEPGAGAAKAPEAGPSRRATRTPARTQTRARATTRARMWRRRARRPSNAYP